MSYSSGAFVPGLTGYIFDRNGNIQGTSLTVSGATILGSSTSTNITVNQQTTLGATGTCTFGSNITSGQGLSINTGSTNYIFPNITNLGIVSFATLGNGTITGLSNITVSNLSALYIKQPSFSGFTVTSLWGILTDGAVYINNSGASSSVTTGALVVGGGAGIAGNLNVGGTISGAVSSTRVISAAGSSASPGFAFTGLSTGMYYNTGASSLVLVNGATDSLSVLSTGNVSMSRALLLPNVGTVSNPAIAIGTAANDGIYSSGAGNVNISTLGVARVTVNAAQITINTSTQVVAGTAAICGYQLAAINDGFYRIAAGNPAVSAAGTSIMNWTGTYTSISVAGGAAAPSLIWGDTSTGFYRPALNQLSFAVNGISMANFTSAGISIASGSLGVSSATNQIVLGTANTVTLTISVAASRTYTFPDAGGPASFVLNSYTGGQVISGGLTLTGATVFSSSVSATSGSFDFSGSSGIFKTSTGAVTLGTGPITATGQMILTSSGSSTSSLASVYVSPVSTALSGASNFYFTYFNAPATSGTTTGIASTVTISGAPVNVSGTSLALYILSGKSQFADSTVSSGSTTGAVTITGGLGVGGSLFCGSSINGTTSIFSATSNQIILGTTNTVTLSSVAPSASRVYTLIDAGGAAAFMMTTSTGGQSIAGGLTSSGTLTASSSFVVSAGNINMSGSIGTFQSPSGVITLGTGSILLTGAAVFSGGVTTTAGNFVLSGSAGNFATTTGAVTIGPGAVSLTGASSFSSTGNITTSSATLYVAPASTTLSGLNNYYFSYFAQPTTTGTTTGTAATVTISGSPSGATNSYSLYVVAGKSYIADSTASASYSTGALTIAGGVGIAGNLYVNGTIFGTVNGTINTSAVSLMASSNQIVLGPGPTITLNSTTPVVSRVYNIPDAGGAAAFVMTTSTGGQTIAGTVTFSGGVAATAGNIDFSGTSGTFNTSLGKNTINGVIYKTPNVILTGNTTIDITSVGVKSFIPCSSPNSFTVTLPTTAGNNGLEYKLVNVGTGFVTIIVANVGTEYFNGDTSLSSFVLNQYDRVCITCYGGMWFNF